MQSTMHYERTFNRTHICSIDETYLLRVSPCRLRLIDYVVSDDFTLRHSKCGCVGTFHFLEPGKLPLGRYKLRLEQGLSLDIRIVSIGENEATFVVENLDNATWAKLMEGARPIIEQDDAVDALRRQMTLLEQRVAALEGKPIY